jgi:hypothetical protein
MMKRPIWHIAGWVLAATLPAASAHAQLEGMLGKGSHGTDLKGLAGMANAPMTSSGMGNVAGLLQYCIGNNYLSGAGAGSVKDQLMGKLPGGAQTQDPGYSDGVKGLLHGSNGNLMDLGGAASGGGGGTGGMTADLTRKACDTILKQAKSFL